LFEEDWNLGKGFNVGGSVYGMLIATHRRRLLVLIVLFLVALLALRQLTLRLNCKVESRTQIIPELGIEVMIKDEACDSLGATYTVNISVRELYSRSEFLPIFEYSPTSFSSEPIISSHGPRGFTISLNEVGYYKYKVEKFSGFEIVYRIGSYRNNNGQ
jgi:hypothetical protein